MSRRTIIKGALILTVANIITRVIGFFYRIYMAKEIGAEGMGLYQLITPLYMLVWSLSSSGLSTTMSKLTAQEKAKGNIGDVKRLLHIAICIAVFISTALSFITYFKSGEIALNIIKDTRTELSLRIISLCFPFMAMGSVLRGYYLGLQNTKISATSQVLEQASRMVIIYLLSSTMIPLGLEYACAAAVWGMTIGELVAFTYVFIYYLFKRKKYNKASLSINAAFLMIIATAIPLTLNKVTSSLFVSVENIMLPKQLQLFGYTQGEALSILGRLSGMAMPLIMFPSSLLMALSTATMPAISENNALNQTIKIKSTIHQSMVITSIVGAFTAGIFIFFPKEIGILVYSQQQISYMLRILGIICPFIYIQVTMSGILNGLGEQVFIFKINLVSSIITIISIYLLVPVIGINGYLLPWIFTAILTTTCTVIRVNKILKINIPLVSLYFKPTLAVICSCLVSKLAHDHLWYNIDYKLGVIFTLTCSFLIYLFLIFELDCINKNDLKL